MRTLILPGLNGSDEGHWQWYWQKDHSDAHIVVQDDWSRPSLDCWVANVEQALEREGEAYIVAHSLGCLVAAKLAARGSANRVKAALLVAPCDPLITDQLHPGAISFGKLEDGRLPFPNIVVGSLNDHYMPIDRLTSTGEKWQANILNLGMAGHINIASGFGRWTSGYSLLDGLVSKVKAQKRKFAYLSFDEPQVRPC